jgi:hypothetical protein
MINPFNPNAAHMNNAVISITLVQKIRQVTLSEWNST